MRIVWQILGLIFVGVGIVGYVLPIMPGTVFMIIALFCFRKGASQGFVDWMLNNRFFGATLRDWEENRWITVRTKVMASLVMVLFVGYSLWRMPVEFKILTGALAAIGLFYIWTRRTKVVPTDESVRAQVA